MTSLQPNSIYSSACIQALTYLDREITLQHKRSKKLSLGMTLFADQLTHSAAGVAARPGLRIEMKRGPMVCQGWNMAYAITYPFLGDLEP